MQLEHAWVFSLRRAFAGMLRGPVEPRPVSPSMIAPGAVLAGKYRVERMLGEGGMGVVVAAYHEALDQRVALKLLRGGAMERPDVVERFLREARSAVKLRSNHVARVFDVGKLDNGWPYIVMEYLEGSDIDHEIRKNGPMNIERAVGLVLQACEAVAEAHALGIVHRDIKPHNLFLTTGFGGSDLVKVLDFGIAKSTAMQGVLTRTDSSVGSPLYMSPEQMRTPRDIDARTDIWSLGVTLYEMIAGRPPFDAENFPELVLKVTEGRCAPLSSARQEVPRALSDIVDRCMQRDRIARWANVAELATALEPFAAPDSRVAAENARRALGASSRNMPKAAPSGPAALAPASEPAPSTLNETEIETARGPAINTGPSSEVPSTVAESAQSVPFELRPLAGSGTSGPNAWSGSASESIPKSRSPWIAMSLGVLLTFGLGATYAAFKMKKEPAVPAASAPPIVVTVTPPVATEVATVVPLASVSAAPSAMKTSPEKRRPAELGMGTRPVSSAKPRASSERAAPSVTAGHPPAPKPSDEIPAER
jgi:eukaryotic-like serine/threonine-protein kinase